MQTEPDLQQKSEIADAELGVAEELGWGVAAFAGIATYLKWESWLLALIVFILAYGISIYRYRRRAAMAEDLYFKSAGLGKYVRASKGV
jgi:type II secretory pathway component PulF